MMMSAEKYSAYHITDLIVRLRNVKPLIHNITNYVAMSFNANALLAIGASPIMAHAIEEVTDIVQIAKALVINIGTLDSLLIKSLRDAMQKAKEINLPIIIDPVGSGVSPYRTQTILELLEIANPQIIRGNASEIMSLAGKALSKNKGVDSVYKSDEAFDIGHEIAERYRCTVVISGQQDFIISPQTTYRIDNGVALMSQVTAMGCTASALIGAFSAVESDPLLAAVAAMAVMGIAGELAYRQAKNPGSFQIQFLDALYNLQAKDIEQYLKLTRLTK
jgi:hydroxyethylthiazole kinase